MRKGVGIIHSSKAIMNYPVYYELSFEGFRKYVEYMRLTTHDIVDKVALSPQETVAMKAILVKSVDEYNERVEYSEYYQVTLAYFCIQYVAYFNKKREKVIWLNGFTKECSFYSSKDSSYFESNVVDVEDGGNGYFDTVINLATGKASGINIHGSA